MPSKLERYKRLGSGIASALGKRPVGFDARVRESGVGRGRYSPEFRGIRGPTKDQIKNNQLRNAITAHLKPIHDKAPKQDGKAILPAHWKSKELKAIVEKHPDLFPDGLTSHKMHEILIGSKDRGKGRTGYVDWIYDTITKKPEKTLEKQLAELVGEKPGGIISSSLGRSLPDDLSTVGRVNEFFTSQGINPKGIPELFPQQSFDFKVNSLTRENLQNFIKNDVSIQKKLRSDPYNYTIKKDGSHEFLPITLHNSHADRSLRPMDPSFNFQGIDTKDIKILGSTVNTVVQRDLEWALANYIKNKDVKNSKRIISKMKEYFIGTKLNDPQAGFPKLNDDDYQWLINNKIVSAAFPDEIVFGTLKKPNYVQIIEGELKARKEHLLLKRMYKQEYGKSDQKFYKTLAQGGIVNGYSGGGKVKKLTQLLDDTIGMMSRRKFLKGMGATAASAAIPKSALKLAPAVIKKGALNFAPPWVNGMLSALKTAEKLPAFEARRAVMGKNFQLMGGTPVGNDAKIINMGSNKIKLYKDETATETHFKVKTGDQVMAEKLSPGFRDQEAWWDDVVLTEEKGQTTITWKNKAYQDGNDQHVVIDKISKETRFVDDNWQMEPGGGDIIKDDWVEYVMNTDKKKLAREMGLAKGDEIGESLVDEWSVKGLDNSYSGMFQSFVDSFSPSGNIFGTVAKLKNALTKPKPVTKQIKDIEEEDMMKWEDQFRGGKGIHGYYRGGTTMEDYPPSMDMDRIINAIGMQESSGGKRLLGDTIRFDVNTAPHQRTERGQGLLHIRPSTALDPGHDIPAWKNFHTEWRDEDKQKQFARNYLNKAHRKFGTWEDAISSWLWGFGNVDKKKHNLDYYNKIMGYYNKGGIARRPNAVPPEKGPDPYGNLIDESVTQIMNSPSEFMGSQFIQKFNKGGFVKKNAPKVIGMITNYKPKLTMSDVLKNIQKAKKQTAGKRIIEESVAEQPGAMFWGSREKIIGAPTEAMTARQWLQYLQLPKHGILNPKGYPIIKHAELNDTSLAPWLSRMENKTISKDALVKQFDEMAPTMDVTVLGETTGQRIISDLSTKLKGVDTQAIRNPAIKGFFDYVKAVMPQLKESTTDDAAKAVIKGIDDMVFNNFGVKDALTEGVPQRFPFEIKEVLQQLSTALGKRTAGFKTYKRSPQHRGTQMMEGGDNYREFLFKYKPGSLRQKEPEYQYAHDFNLSSEDRAGGIVHARTSDRADQFGRRLLHIEEIQSDMHQKINMAQRKLKKRHAIWEKDGLTPEKGYSRLTKSEKKEYDNLVRDGKYAPRGDLQEEISTANEQHLLLVKAKIEDLLAQKQTASIKTRLNRLNKERIKLRYIIDAEKKKMAQGNHSGVPQGPLSKTEDYNEFIMKYLLRVAREGGYDGITINTPAIKNLGMSSTGRDYKGNLVAYGPMAQGAMKKAAKKSGAKFMKTVIVDGDNRVWEVPMILFKENKAAQALIDKGLPVYKKGGTVKK